MLVQVRHRPGQKHIFLMFRTDQGLRLCLSRDISFVKSMQIGKKYRVRGQECTTGSRTYLNMASAKLVGSHVVLFRKRVGLVASLASFVFIAGYVGSGLSLSGGSSTRNNQADTPDVEIQNKQTVETPNGSNKINNIIKPPDSSNQTTTSDSSRPVPTPQPQPVIATPAPAAANPSPTPEPTPSPTPTPEPTPSPTPSPTPEPTPPSPPPAELVAPTPAPPAD